MCAGTRVLLVRRVRLALRVCRGLLVRLAILVLLDQPGLRVQHLT